MPVKAENTGPEDSDIMSRYDRLAACYDNKRYVSESSRFINRIEMRVITDWVYNEGGCSLLDVPCGTGRLTVAMAGLAERVVGGDVSAKMIAVANNKICAECMDKVYLLRLNARRLPFPDNTFDIVLCVSFFHLIDNHEKNIFMDEFRRVLKPGGKLILENVSPVYGQIERLVRLRVSLNEIPGKLIFPGLEQRIMKGYRKRRELGIGFPLFSKLAVIFGEDRIIKITRVLGNVPLLKFFGYSIITELEKEPTTARGFEILG